MRHADTQPLDFAQKVALFVTAMHKDKAVALLDGLAPRERERAQAFSGDVRGWDSARRHARLAWEFGVRPDAEEKLEVLVAGVSGGLREAVVALLPLAMQRRFPRRAGGVGGAESAPDLVWGVAARLIREVSR